MGLARIRDRSASCSFRAVTAARSVCSRAATRANMSGAADPRHYKLFHYGRFDIAMFDKISACRRAGLLHKIASKSPHLYDPTVGAIVQ